jgi:hypothetical protein
LADCSMVGENFNRTNLPRERFALKDCAWVVEAMSLFKLLLSV